MTTPTTTPADPTSGINPVGSRGLAARRVTLAYGDRVVVEDLDLAVVPGAVTAIVGPNGCGKSTVLRALARLIRPRSGEVLLDGESLSEVNTRSVARRIGLLPQSPLAPDGLTVADLVARGRHPHQRWFRQWSRDDERVVASALDVTGLDDLADRPLEELSGGQRQRAWIAMVLAQEPDVLLLDEPTTFLDLAHAIEVLDLVDRLNHEDGRTVVLVLHDLNMAARYSDQLVVMRDGRVVALGPPAEVLSEQLVRTVFGVECRVVPDPSSGAPLVLPSAPTRRSRT